MTEQVQPIQRPTRQFGNKSQKMTGLVITFAVSITSVLDIRELLYRKYQTGQCDKNNLNINQTEAAAVKGYDTTGSKANHRCLSDLNSHKNADLQNPEGFTQQQNDDIQIQMLNQNQYMSSYLDLAIDKALTGQLIELRTDKKPIIQQVLNFKQNRKAYNWHFDFELIIAQSKSFTQEINNKVVKKYLYDKYEIINGNYTGETAKLQIRDTQLIEQVFLVLEQFRNKQLRDQMAYLDRLEKLNKHFRIVGRDISRMACIRMIEQMETMNERHNYVYSANVSDSKYVWLIKHPIYNDSALRLREPGLAGESLRLLTLVKKMLEYEE